MFCLKRSKLFIKCHHPILQSVRQPDCPSHSSPVQGATHHSPDLHIPLVESVIQKDHHIGENLEQVPSLVEIFPIQLAQPARRRYLASI
jgi:hypothetical protein